MIYRIAIASLLLSSILAPAAQAQEKPDPVLNSSVRVTGWPRYLENLSIGSPLSDYGSHNGIKASADADGDNYPTYTEPARLSELTFFKTAHYAAYPMPGLSRQMDQSYIYLRNVDTGEILFGPLADPADERERELDFRPYGWFDTSNHNGVKATGFAGTLGADSFLFAYEVTNTTGGPVTLEPVLVVTSDRDPVDEGPSAAANAPSTSADYNSLHDMTLLNTDDERYRGVFADWSPTAISTTVDGQGRYLIEIVGPEISLEDEEFIDGHFVFVYGLSENEVIDNVESARGAMGSNANEAAFVVTVSFELLLAIAEFPHTGEPDELQTYLAGLTALVHSGYGAVPGMQHGLVTSSGKVRKPWMLPGDIALQALGYREFDPAYSRALIAGMLDAMHSDGSLPPAFDGNLFEPAGLEGLSAPPLFLGIAEDIYWAGGGAVGDSVDWLGRVYEAGAAMIGFWQAQRDPDGDGLFSYADIAETGAYDSPRFGCDNEGQCIEDVASITPVDLNAGMYESYLAMASMALTLPQFGREEADFWLLQARELRGAFEELLWNDQWGAYLDRRADGSWVEVATPALFAPLAAGLTADAGRAASIIDNYLLASDGFWGEPGSRDGKVATVPSLAFNSPDIDADGDGHYLQGQMRPRDAYNALRALFRYGYEEQSAHLRDNLLLTLSLADDSAIYETYGAADGLIGWGRGRGAADAGPFAVGDAGEPAVFQAPSEAAAVVSTLVDRHQYNRYLMPGELEARGFIGQLEFLGGDIALMVIGELGKQPMIEATLSGSDELGAGDFIDLLIYDPYYNLLTTDEEGSPRLFSVAVALPTAVRIKLEITFPDGTVQQETTPVGINYFILENIPFERAAAPTIRITSLAALDERSEDAGGGCGCLVSPGASGGLYQVLILLAGLCAYIGVLRLRRHDTPAG